MTPAGGAGLIGSIEALRLPLDQIRASAEYPRRQTAIELQPLVMSLVRYGQLEPIRVRPLDDDLYEAVDGQCRVEALRIIDALPALAVETRTALELGTVAAVVHHCSATDAAKWRFVHTESSRPLSPFERAHALVGWWVTANRERGYEIPSREFAAMSGVSHTSVTQAQLIVWTLTPDEFLAAGLARDDGVDWNAVHRLRKEVLLTATRRRGEQRHRTLREGARLSSAESSFTTSNDERTGSSEQCTTLGREARTRPTLTQTLDDLLTDPSHEPDDAQGGGEQQHELHDGAQARDELYQASPGRDEVHDGDPPESNAAAYCALGRASGTVQDDFGREPTLAATAADADAIRADVFTAAERGDGVRIRFVAPRQSLAPARARALSAKAEAVVLAMVPQFLDRDTPFFVAQHASGIVVVIPRSPADRLSVSDQMPDPGGRALVTVLTHAVTDALRHAYGPSLLAVDVALAEPTENPDVTNDGSRDE